MINRFFLILCIITLSACDYKDIKQTEKLQEAKAPFVASEKACFESCDIYKKTCTQLKEANTICSKNLTLTDCRKSLDILKDIHSYSFHENSNCKDECANISYKNRLRICETSEDFKNLTAETLNQFIKTKDRTLKSLQLSKYLFDFKDPKFQENYTKVQSAEVEKNLIKIPKMKIFEEGDYKNRKVEFWLKGSELDCLPTLVKNLLKKNKALNKESVNLTKFRSSIMQACRLNDFKLIESQNLSSYNKKLKLINYVTEGTPQGDCGYTTPRLEFKYSFADKSKLLISKEANVLKDPESIDLIKFIFEYRDLYISGGGLIVEDLISYKGNIFAVIGEMAMSEAYSLHRFTDFGMVPTKSQVYSEPCGS